MWTKYINVSLQVAEIQLTKNELEDVIFGMKLANSSPSRVEKLEMILDSMLRDQEI